MDRKKYDIPELHQKRMHSENYPRSLLIGIEQFTLF